MEMFVGVYTLHGDRLRVFPMINPQSRTESKRTEAVRTFYT